MADAPLAAPDFAPAEVAVDRLGGGVTVWRSPQALGDHPEKLGEIVYLWADAAPERVFLAERDAAGSWRRLTYAELAGAVEAIGQALVERGLGPERPAMILSDNGIDNALLLFAGMHVGVPVAPVSPAYSLMSRDHAKLRYIFDLVRPGLVFAADGKAFAGAFAALPLDGVALVCSADPPAGATSFAALRETPPGAALRAAFDRVGPETVAKILFTSGSTGEPKGVLNTQRMLCSNVQAVVQVWPFLRAAPPVTVDWLPWSHTFGGNFNLNSFLYNGGTLYIDDGKPLPQLIGRTARNLAEVSPTVYYNVPRGFDMLLPHLEGDAALRDSFFRALQMMLFAGAALPGNLWRAYEALSVQARGERVPFVAAWGSTETAPAATVVHYPMAQSNNIGLPVPGTEIKLVPSGEKLEMRVRGPNVTPGYWKRPDLTAEAFDEDGFYCIGDAGKPADADDPARGLLFDGRTAESFKLMSGTWVHVGTLRTAVLEALAPVAQDAVVVGHDREELGLLIFPSAAGCRSLCPAAPEDAPLAMLIADEAVRARVAEGLAAHNADNPGNSTRISFALLMEEPPSIDAGEITDKGYINQRAVRERRAGLVERLYAGDPAAIRAG